MKHKKIVAGMAAFMMMGAVSLAASAADNTLYTSIPRTSSHTEKSVSYSSMTMREYYDYSSSTYYSTVAAGYTDSGANSYKFDVEYIYNNTVYNDSTGYISSSYKDEIVYRKNTSSKKLTRVDLTGYSYERIGIYYSYRSSLEIDASIT